MHAWNQPLVYDVICLMTRNQGIEIRLALSNIVPNIPLLKCSLPSHTALGSAGLEVFDAKEECFHINKAPPTKDK